MMIKPSKNLITMYEPNSPASEAFRTLRTNLTLRDFDKKLKVINVISTTAKESKTTTVLNLAYVYSQLGKKVLVIDLDLRSPSIHKKLNIKNKNGLSDILSGQVNITEALVHVTDNMDFILAGTKIPFAAEFIQSRMLKEFINGLKEKYSLILLDCPPVGLVTDGVIASNLADGTILCLASGKNDTKDLEKTKDLLEQTNVNILGIVMTRMTMTKKYYDYSYGYTSGSKKGKNNRK